MDKFDEFNITTLFRSGLLSSDTIPKISENPQATKTIVVAGCKKLIEIPANQHTKP